MTVFTVRVVVLADGERGVRPSPFPAPAGAGEAVVAPGAAEVDPEDGLEERVLDPFPAVVVEAPGLVGEVGPGPAVLVGWGVLQEVGLDPPPAGELDAVEGEAVVEPGEEAGTEEVEMGSDDVEVEPDDVEVEPDDVEVEPDRVEVEPDRIEVESAGADVAYDGEEVGYEAEDVRPVGEEVDGVADSGALAWAVAGVTWVAVPDDAHAGAAGSATIPRARPGAKSKGSRPRRRGRPSPTGWSPAAIETSAVALDRSPGSVRRGKTSPFVGNRGSGQRRRASEGSLASRHHGRRSASKAPR